MPTPDTGQRRCSVTIFREGPGDFVVEAGVMRGGRDGAHFDRREEWANTAPEARKLAAQMAHQLRRQPSCRASSGLGGARRRRRSRR